MLYLCSAFMSVSGIVQLVQTEVLDQSSSVYILLQKPDTHCLRFRSVSLSGVLVQGHLHPHQQSL